PQGAGAIAERTVEEGARQLADAVAVVGACAERRRAGPDREVRVTELRRDGARGLLPLREVAGKSERHPAELVVEPLDVADAALDVTLRRDGARPRRALGRRWSVPARPAAPGHPALPGDPPRELVVAGRRETADRLDAGRGEPLGGTRADTREHPGRERRQEL